MGEREYQEDFYTLYNHFQDGENRLSKGRKAVKMMHDYGGRALDQLECLDIGCSSGIITSYAMPFFKKITGLDYDKIGLQNLSKEQKEQTLFLRGDAMTLPFDDNSFDAVICVQVYEHVPSDLRLFAEIERVLRADGIVFFSGPNKAFPVELHTYLPFIHWFPERIADKYSRIMGKGDHFYERSRTLWDLRKVLKSFEIYDVTIPVLHLFASWSKNTFTRFIYRSVARMPKLFRPVLLPLMPNFNLVLRKKTPEAGRNVYKVVE